jgi:hypothetical protein
MGDMPTPPGVPEGEDDASTEMPDVSALANAGAGGTMPGGSVPGTPDVASAAGGSSTVGMVQDGVKMAQSVQQGNAMEAADAAVDMAGTGAATYFGGEAGGRAARMFLNSAPGQLAKRGVVWAVGITAGALILTGVTAGAGVVSVASMAVTSWGGVSLACLPVASGGGSTPLENPTKEQVAAAIYAQVKGFGYGDAAAAIAIGVANAEKGLTANTDGADGTTSRGYYQQMQFWAPDDLVWSGKGKCNGGCPQYNKDNAFGPDGWAINDPRMNAHQSANLFIVGSGPGSGSGVGGMDDPTVPFKDYLMVNGITRFNQMDWDKAIAISHHIQAFPAKYKPSHLGNMMVGFAYYEKIIRGEIPVPSFATPYDWMQPRASSPQTQGAFARSIGARDTRNASVNSASTSSPVGAARVPAVPEAPIPSNTQMDGITFIGDSVMRDLLRENKPTSSMFRGPAIQHALVGIGLHSIVNSDSAYSEYEKRREDMKEWRKDISTGPSRILVQLGTNDGTNFARNYANIKKFMKLAGPRQVYWFSQHYKPSQPMQEALEKAAGEYSNLHLIPVLDLLPGGTYGMELHPGSAYENMWQRAMQALSESATVPVDPNCVGGIGPDGPIDINPGASWLPGPDATAPATGYSVNIEGGRNMTYYSQCDDKWRYWQNYSMCGCGCGHTSMAMVIATLGPQPDYTPAHAYTEQRRLGGVNGSCGTAGGSDVFFRTMASKYNIPSWDINNDFDAARRILQQGGLVTVSIHKGTILTPSGGHYVVLRGIAPDGKFLIADPGNRAFSVSAGFSESVFSGHLNQGMVGFLPPGATLR